MTPLSGESVAAHEAPTVLIVSQVYVPDPANDALNGQPLQIRLCALEDPSDLAATTWVAFDEITLETGLPIKYGLSIILR